MNRDEIIRMAREAGFENSEYGLNCTPGMYAYNMGIVERFAALVATFVADRMIRNGYRKCAEGQRETQFCGQLEAAVAGAIAAEREACAIAGAAAAMAGKDYVGVAAAIRARGNV